MYIKTNFIVISLYLIVEIVTPDAIWYNQPLHSQPYLCLGIFEGDGITSQMEGYFSILLLSILLCHIGL